MRRCGSARGVRPAASVTVSIGLAHPDDVADVERARVVDPLAVHERPVRRPEVLDRQLVPRCRARPARGGARSRGRRRACPRPRRPTRPISRSPSTAQRSPRALPSVTRSCSPAIDAEPYASPAGAASLDFGVRACPSCGEETPEGARFCPACGMALAGGPRRQGFRKVVTIVFCDLCDSTELGERLDPESLRQVIARYFGAMSAALERHGGAVEKFIGDAVMAVFGIPTVREDDALRAVRAAADMRTALARAQRAARAALRASRLEARTGVNTGEVIAGDPSRGEGFVSGDAVNVAARLEQAAAPRRDPHRRAHARARRARGHRSSRVPPLDLKGKSAAGSGLPAASTSTASAADGRGLGARRWSAASASWQQLRGAFDRAVDRAHAVSWSRSSAPPASASRGSPATSRTRCASEAAVAAGRCLSYGEGLTFWPLREVVAALAGTDDGDERRGGAGRDRAPAAGRRRHGHDRRARRGRARAVGRPPPTRRRPSGPCGSCSRRPRAERPLVVVLRGHPLGRAHLPRPDRAPRGDDRGRARADRRARAHGPARRQARLRRRRRRHADRARAAQRRRQPARWSSTCSATPAWPPTSPSASSRAPRAIRCSSRSSCACSSTSVSSSATSRALRRALVAARACRRPSMRCWPPASTASSRPSAPIVEAGAVVGRSFGGGALLELSRRRRPRRARRAPDSARAQAADRAGRRAPRGRADLQLHATCSSATSPTRASSRRVAPISTRASRTGSSATAGERAGEYDEILGYHLERAYRYLRRARPARRARPRARRPRRRPARLVRRPRARARRHPARRQPARAGRLAARRRRSGPARPHDQARHRAGRDRPAHRAPTPSSRERIEAERRGQRVRRLPRRGRASSTSSTSTTSARRSASAAAPTTTSRWPGTTRSRAATRALSRAGRRAGCSSTTTRATAPT